MVGHWGRQILLMVVVSVANAAFIDPVGMNPAMAETQEVLTGHSAHLKGAKVYLRAGDYRRAIEACQRQIDDYPSVESYVYLAYVYQALDGYLMSLVKQEDYVKVEQLSLNLTAREIIDLIDPPNVMPRMAQELIHEGVRQQFDVTAAMANRLSHPRTDELWTQQAAWRENNPDGWWAGIPPEWKW
ncbi:MAG: tol-pal system YbgF family protein [Nitrospirales bacterium]